MQNIIPINQLVNQPAKAAITDFQRTQIHKAAIEFESIFLNEMLKPMFDGMGVDDPAFGGSREESIYQSMMIDEVSKGISKAGGIGIAEHVERELLKLQEQAGA